MSHYIFVVREPKSISKTKVAYFKMSRCQTDFNYKIYNHPIRPPWLISYLNVSSDPCGFFDENLNKICHLWTTTTYLSKDKFVFIRKSRVNLLEMRGGVCPLETFWAKIKMEISYHEKYGCSKSNVNGSLDCWHDKSITRKMLICVIGFIF